MDIPFDMNEMKYVVGVDFGDGQKVPAHQHPKGGGWVAETAHVDDDCYVGPFAGVYGEARVTDGAIINDYAKVFGNALVYGNAKVYGDARVYDLAQVYGNARVNGYAEVYENSRVLDNALVYGNANIRGNAIVRNNSEVFNDAIIAGDADIYDSIKVYDNCVVTKKPKACFGFDYNVIITDHHVSLGCVSIPPKFIETTVKRIVRLMRYTPEQAEEWTKTLRFVTDFHGCTDREEDINNFDERKILRDLLESKVGIRQ